MLQEVRFANESLNTVHTSTDNARQKYEDIWANVRNSLVRMIAEGHVDASIAGALETRDNEFRAACNGFDDNVGTIKQAMHRVQEIGIEGGQGMLRALR